MVVGEPEVLISRYPPSSVPVLSSVTTGVLPMRASASYEIVVMSLTATNCFVFLGSSVQPEHVCGTSGIVLRVSQSSSCVVTSGVNVVLLVAVVVPCVVTVSIVVVNIEVVGLFVWVVLFVVLDAVCGGVFVFRLMVTAVVVGASLVVGDLFVVAVYVVAWFCDVAYLLVVI